MINTYRIKDIGLAAALLSSGKSMVEISKEGGICWFMFNDLDGCIALDKKYWFGELLVNAKTYKKNLDELKVLIHK